MLLFGILYYSLSGKTLRGYSIFVAKVRKYIVETKESHKKNTEEFFYLDEKERQSIIAEAVTQAIDWCIENDILKEFFQKYREEAVSVSVIEYSAERHMQAIKEEGYDIGLEEGLKRGISQGHTNGLQEGISGAVSLLREMGLDETTILKKISEQYDISTEQAEKYL